MRTMGLRGSRRFRRFTRGIGSKKQNYKSIYSITDYGNKVGNI